MAAAQPDNKVPTISFRKDPVSADLAIAGPAVPVPGTHTHALRSVTAFLATSCASLALSTLSHYHNLKLLHIWRPAHPQGLAPYESPGVTSFFLAASLGPQFRRTSATIRGAHHFAIMSVVAQRLHMHPLISFSLASRLPAPPTPRPSPLLFSFLPACHPPPAPATFVPIILTVHTPSVSLSGSDTCGIRTHVGRPHRLSRPAP